MLAMKLPPLLGRRSHVLTLIVTFIHVDIHCITDAHTQLHTITYVCISMCIHILYTHIVYSYDFICASHGLSDSWDCVVAWKIGRVAEARGYRAGGAETRWTWRDPPGGYV